MDLSLYRTFMTELARDSGDFIRPLFRQRSVAVETKSDQTPVTIADRGAEQLMRTRIAKRFPEHGIIGEEFGSERAESGELRGYGQTDFSKAFSTPA